MICKYFLSFHRSPFHSVDGAFRCTEVFNFDIVQFVYFYFCCLWFGYCVHEVPAKPMSWNFPPTVSSKTFIVLGLTFRFLMDFDLISFCVCIHIYSVKAQVLHVEIQFPQYLLLRNLWSPQLNGHGALQKVSWPCVRAYFRSLLYSIGQYVCLCYPAVIL